MRIRKATPADVDAIFNLATDFAISFDVEERPFWASFQQILLDDHAVLLVAVEKTKLSAIASASNTPPSSRMARSHGLKR